MASLHLQDTAERVLWQMRSQGFDAAQVTVSATRQDELNIAHDEPSLLRSNEALRLALVGVIDGRKASTELSALGEDQILALAAASAAAA